MTNQEISSFCEASEPLLIYLAIGPAGSAEQQYPPFLKRIGGEQICILIDPRLEDPPVAYTEAHPPPDASMTVMDNVTFIPLRRYFQHTGEHPEDMILLHQLCYAAISSRKTRLIVQDYSGFDLRRIYPLDIFGPQLRSHVLFDFSYGEGSCFVDFSKVHLLVHEQGGFVQPHYETLAQILPYCTWDQFAFQVTERHTIITTYVKRYYRILRGEEPEREWCPEHLVLTNIARLCPIYGLPVAVDVNTLEKLLTAYLFDLCACSGNFMGETDALSLIRRPERDYEMSVLLMKQIFTENNLPL